MAGTTVIVRSTKDQGILLAAKIAAQCVSYE